MIPYNRSAFGLNLIFQVHGSAVYRAVFPSLLSTGIFFIWKHFYNPQESYGDTLGHPYAVGAVIASASFLVVFRANQGYARYWEGCGAVHHMMSKWMDSTTHAGVYHLQCDHYLEIQPPSYYDFPEMNYMYLTRDRERATVEFEDSDDNDSDDNDSDEDDNDGKISSNGNLVDSCNGTDPRKDQNDTGTSLSNSSIGQRMRKLTQRHYSQPIYTSHHSSSNHGGAKRKVSRDEKMKRKLHAVVKSINSVDRKEQILDLTKNYQKIRLTGGGGRGQGRGNSSASPSAMVFSDSTLPPLTLPSTATKLVTPAIVEASPDVRRTLSADDIGIVTSNTIPLDGTSTSVGLQDLSSTVEANPASLPQLRRRPKQSPTQPGNGDPSRLCGPPRLDGGWQGFYSAKEDTKNATPLEVFSNPDHLQFEKTIPSSMKATIKEKPLPIEGFASTQGGRTPSLYLQELAHLSSLLVAVALSTLRNDIDGSESPLAFYEPGSPWPDVDPDKDDWIKSTDTWHVWRRKLGQFLGMGRSPEEQTRYNAGRPLPVIGGVSNAEIQFLQMARGPYAKTQLCWSWLSEFMMREHLAGSMGKVGPPIVSRCIQFLGDGMIFYNHARKIMFIPFPFVHAQLSVLFILVLIPLVPFLMDQWVEEAWIGSVLSFLTVLCLAGVNEVARELENPFRNVPNELPLVTFMAQYNEALITMYSGFHPDHYWDGEQVTGLPPLRKRRVNGKIPRPQTPSNFKIPGSSFKRHNPTVKSHQVDVGETSGSVLFEKQCSNAVEKERNSDRQPLSTKESKSEMFKRLSRAEAPLTETESIAGGDQLNTSVLPPTQRSEEQKEIAQLKDQLARQAKLIDQLCAKMQVGEGRKLD